MKQSVFSFPGYPTLYLMQITVPGNYSSEHAGGIFTEVHIKHTFTEQKGKKNQKK